jgi:DNA invertase Pin-like site-specific DNA recombinase
MVTRLDRLARSTRDLLNILSQIGERGAGFRSLGDAWADTTTPHGRLILTVTASNRPGIVGGTERRTTRPAPFSSY